MEVILQENYPSLGYVGDRVSVKGGFARNFLIPRGIAVEASTHNERVLKHRMQHIMAKRIRLKSEAEALAQQLAGATLEFTLKMSDSGKSFGSVTTRDIEAALKAKGFAVDRKQIRVTDTFRKAGEYKIGVKLHAEVTASVPVKVTSEVTETKTADAKEARRGRGKRKAEGDAEATEAVAAGTTEAAAETAGAEGTEKPKAKRKKKEAPAEESKS
jgi:large subunit ribosomal protein L9